MKKIKECYRGVTRERRRAIENGRGVIVRESGREYLAKKQASHSLVFPCH